MTRAEPEPESGGPWSRFASAFAARRGSRWAWRALLFCVGLAVFAPLLANERPYFARFRDVLRFEELRVSLAPVARDVAEEALAGAPEPHASHGALRARLRELDRLLAPADRPEARAAIQAAGDALERLEAAEIRGSDRAELRERASALSDAAAACAGALRLDAGDLAPLRARNHWPLFASVSSRDLVAMYAWIFAACAAFGSAGAGMRRARIVVFALCVASAALYLSSPSHAFAQVDWKARVAADPAAFSLEPPIAFGPSETDLARALEAPFDGAGAVHVLGTDALGRDLLARILHAGRTSFAAAALASLLIVSLGSLLGLAAGFFRGAVDALVSRAIEALQSLPTLVLLLGIVALLPSSAATSRWTIPLVIAAFGWTHVARLARAEALRVAEMPFVHAATAAGFSRARVLGRHVLPNSLGPVWIAASFVLSAGLVLESSAAFLGFGVQHPAPSFGGLLAEARGGHAWWLALFPGLWLFAAILAIHIVGEGVRAALDPREEGACE